MCASLAHRGPDASGFFRAPGVGLAHRRLSVIDLTTGGQPMGNEDGSIQVVFNGEIYNYQDLTKQLKERGHRFSSTSDTEVILHLYEDHGLGFVEHLRGMFAFALWDAKRRRLVLARDRIGEKPLYYMQEGPALLFGSEPKAILQSNVARRLDAQAVCDFLALGYVPAPRSFYQGIRKVPPGHLLVYEEGAVNSFAYWERRSTRQEGLSFRQAADRLTEMLIDTGRLCLKSDVEVGAFLSGGIDSSVIVALMRLHAARVQTFSVGYGGQATGYNELGYARRVADALGSVHHELIIGARSNLNLLPKVIWHFDEPHGEPTSVLVYLLSRFTKERVKVALGGTGGDEIFFGYPRHKGIGLLQYYRLLPAFLREGVVERIVRKWPESTRGKPFARRAKRFVDGAGLAPEEAYRSWVALLSRELRADLISGAVQAQAEDPSGEALLRRHLMAGDDRTLLDRAAALDIGGYLPEFQLTYMDRMSMAHGLEVRSPLCDFEVVNLVSSLPPSYRLHRMHSKHILKHVARRWLPRGIVERKKMGFDSPIGQWVKNELREFVLAFLSREHVERSGLLNYPAVERILGDHLSGKRNYALQLWSIIALECWYRMYIEDRVCDGAAYRLSDLRGTVSEGRRSVALSGSEPAATADVSATPGGLKSAAPLKWSRRHLWESAPAILRRSLSPVFRVIPTQVFLGKQFRRWAAFVEGAQHWPADMAAQLCLRELRGVCTLAQDRTSFYRRMFREIGFDPRGLKRLEDLRGLPRIDKGTVREHLSGMCMIPLDGSTVDSVSTGGSGGEPLHFYMNMGRSVVEYAYLTTSWGRAGYRLGMPLAVLRGRAVAPDRRGLYHEYDAILRHHYYSNFHMTDENMGRYLRHIATIGPCFLHVYPSSVAALARFIRRAGLKAPGNIRGIIAESETVYPDQRKMVEEVFGCRYFSCYGHSEKLVLAAECEFSTDYHVWPTYGYFELLDEQGKPVTTPGQTGEIVGTGFINRVVPFIRYRTGDYATYVGDHCEACGRQHTIIRDIRGHRTQEMLVAVDGSEISWTALNMHDDTFLHVRQFQFYQDTPGRAVLRVVPAEGFGDEDRRRIQKSLGRKLDGQVTFTIELVESIPLSPRGKAIYVDQRIKEPHASEGPA
jgi:phenylacetate-CoA ligase